MGIFSDDIVKDILRRAVVAAQGNGGGLDDSLALLIEQQVRGDWGGCEPYIAHGKEDRIAARNDKINALYWDDNQRDVRMLAARFGLSVKQIRRIVGI